MNFLAHALLSGEAEPDRVGGLMGDFIKGLLPAGLPADLAAGVALHRAIDSWDTQTIARWIGPQGWISPGGGAAQHTDDGATSGQPADGTSGSPGTGSTPPAPPATSTFSWRNPAVIAVGTTVASTVGVVLFSLRRGRASVAPQKETP